MRSTYPTRPNATNAELPAAMPSATAIELPTIVHAMLTSETRRAARTTSGSNEESAIRRTLPVRLRGFDDHPALHSVREVSRKVTRELEPTRVREPVERLPHVVRRDRDFTGDGRMARFGSELVATVHARVADDELVMDRVVVVHEETHRGSRTNMQRRDRELAVVDADVDRHETGPKRQRGLRMRAGVHRVTGEGGRARNHERNRGVPEPSHAATPGTPGNGGRALRRRRSCSTIATIPNVNTPAIPAATSGQIAHPGSGATTACAAA